MAKRQKKQHEGLGDTIEAITKATGIKKVVKALVGDDCGCEETKQALNVKHSYRLKLHRCLTDQETTWWTTFKEKSKLQLTNSEVEFICKLYSEIFNRQYFRPPVGGSPKPVINMIAKIDEVYNHKIK